MRNRVSSAERASAAHISAVWPRHFSRALTLAPWRTSSSATSKGPRGRGQHQARLPLLVRPLYVAACIEQHPDQARIGTLSRLRQRARAVIVDDIGFRPALEERTGKIRVDLVNGPVQRRCTVS